MEQAPCLSGNEFEGWRLALIKSESEEQVIAPGDDSYRPEELHVFDYVLFVIVAGLAAAMVGYAISRKIFSFGIPVILSALLVLQDVFIKNMKIRLYIDFIILLMGLCICWVDRKFRKNFDS